MNTNFFNNAFPFFRLFQKQAGTLGDAVKQLNGLFHDVKAVRDAVTVIEKILEVKGK